MTEELDTILTDEYVDYMRMWSKRYLQRVRGCVHTVAMIRSELAEVDASLDGLQAIRYDRERVGGDSDDEGLLRRIERADSLRAEFQEELERNLQAQADAHAALAHVRQPWRAVLTYRYLRGMTWANVVAAMAEDGQRYSEDHVRKDMHDNGLVELYPHVPHEFDDFPEAI